MRYSLADYVLAITAPKSLENVFEPLSIGGDNEYVGSINVSFDNDLYDIESYATGAYIFNKNLSKAGKISISLNQLCNKIPQLKKMVNLLRTTGEQQVDDSRGFTFSITQRNATEPLVSAIDCYPTKVPDQVMEASAQMQTWTFLCGEITMK